MSENIENGKVDVMGINIDISQTLGQKIVDQYMMQLKEEDIQKLMNYISQDLFAETYDHKLVVKEREKDRWGSYTTKEVPIGELIKNIFNERIKEELKKRVEEIIASTDYQKKINEIANELVDYSVNGYKEDMKERIRERLVGNVLSESAQYCGVSLLTLINQEIDKRFNR